MAGDNIDFSKIGSGKTDKRHADTFEGREDAKLEEEARGKAWEKYLQDREIERKLKRFNPFRGGAPVDYAKGGHVRAKKSGVRGVGCAAKGHGKMKVY